MSSDSQQSRDAQLSKAFQKTLPRRIGGVQRRLRALAENGWDINTLHLIFVEIQQLAGSSGKYGLVEASEQLSALEIVLGSYLSGAGLPQQEQNEEILRLVGELDQISGGADLEDLDVSQPTVVAKMIATPKLADPVVSPSGLPALENIPNWVRPPAEFLPFEPNAVRPFHRLSPGGDDDLAAPLEQTSDPELNRLAEENLNLELGDIASQIITGDEQFNVQESDQISNDWKRDAAKAQQAEPAPAEPEDSAPAEVDEPIPEPEPTTRTLYYLHRDNDHSKLLAADLGRSFEVNSFADVDDFRDQLSAMGPDAVLIDGVFIDEIETLGPLVRKIRRKQDRPMPMLAFSEATDVAQRLKILRAGADAFMKSTASSREVQRRLSELMRDPQDDPYRVLIVEDDRSQAMFAESILRKAGMAVKMERNPLQVLDHLEEFNPELILMDLYMPECDGMELTSIIRERDDFINTPIVFLSGESNTDKHFDALLAGGDDFLSKPIRPRHLIQAVTNRVQRARALARRKLTRAEPDTVTGLADRPQLLERINDLLAETDNGHSDHPGGVLYDALGDPLDLRQRLGLGGFEMVADQLGPLLSSELGSKDMATRYGDNAYCLLLADRSVEALKNAAEKCVERIASQLFQTGDGTTNMSASIGVCQLTSQFADAGALISAAERACNLGYSSGTSRVNVQELALDFSEESDDSVAMTLELALDKDDLQVLFQPIVSLRGDAEEQYQALVRVNGDDGKPIAASRLIPAAERHGLLGRIDHWMLKRALSVLDERQRLERPIRLFVNQSAHSLTDREVLPRLYKQLQTRGLSASYLVLEFKLPEIANRLKAAVQHCRKLQEIGVKVALGAFDGSNTAFQTLNHLSVDYVKLPASDEDGALGKNLTSVIDRLHHTGQLVIIPAIEDARTAARLWQTGVDFIQGYFVQAPEAELAYQFNESQI
ncbi:MAG: EAL domain-containing protein [Pseudomonadota bacterium]